MKLDVLSHCTIDTIQVNDSKYVVPGGPACYCSLTARILKWYCISCAIHFKILKIRSSAKRREHTKLR